jgi:hypothetical protein
MDLMTREQNNNSLEKWGNAYYLLRKRFQFRYPQLSSLLLPSPQDLMKENSLLPSIEIFKSYFHQFSTPVCLSKMSSPSLASRFEDISSPNKGQKDHKFRRTLIMFEIFQEVLGSQLQQHSRFQAREEDVQLFGWIFPHSASHLFNFPPSDQDFACVLDRFVSFLLPDSEEANKRKIQLLSCCLASGFLHHLSGGKKDQFMDHVLQKIGRCFGKHQASDELFQNFIKQELQLSFPPDFVHQIENNFEQWLSLIKSLTSG